MHEAIEWAKKHPIVIVGILAGALLLYLIYKYLHNSASNTTAQLATAPTPVTGIVSPTSGGVAAIPGTGGAVTTTTDTTTSSVYAPYSSSVYSPTTISSSSYSPSTVSTNSTVDSHNITDSFNPYPVNGTGFSGSVGSGPTPSIANNTPTPILAPQMATLNGMLVPLATAQNGNVATAPGTYISPSSTNTGTFASSGAGAPLPSTVSNVPSTPGYNPNAPTANNGLVYGYTPQ